MNKFPGDQPDWAARYAAIGQFVVEFEWISWHLRFHMCALLQIHGLTKWPLGEIILNQRVFTGETLFACYASMVAECLGTEHVLIRELGGLCKDFQDLCRMRNDLLHAFYLTGNDLRVQVLGGSIEELQLYVATAATVKQKVKEFVPKVIVALAATGLARAHR